MLVVDGHVKFGDHQGQPEFGKFIEDLPDPLRRGHRGRGKMGHKTDGLHRRPFCQKPGDPLLVPVLQMVRKGKDGTLVNRQPGLGIHFPRQAPEVKGGLPADALRDLCKHLRVIMDIPFRQPPGKRAQLVLDPDLYGAFHLPHRHAGIGQHMAMGCPEKGMAAGGNPLLIQPVQGLHDLLPAVMLPPLAGPGRGLQVVLKDHPVEPFLHHLPVFLVIRLIPGEPVGGNRRPEREGVPLHLHLYLRAGKGSPLPVNHFHQEFCHADLAYPLFGHLPPGRVLFLPGVGKGVCCIRHRQQREVVSFTRGVPQVHDLHAANLKLLFIKADMELQVPVAGSGGHHRVVIVGVPFLRDRPVAALLQGLTRIFLSLNQQVGDGSPLDIPLQAAPEPQADKDQVPFLCRLPRVPPGLGVPGFFCGKMGPDPHCLTEREVRFIHGKISNLNRAHRPEIRRYPADITGVETSCHQNLF